MTEQKNIHENYQSQVTGSPIDVAEAEREYRTEAEKFKQEHGYYPEEEPPQERQSMSLTIPPNVTIEERLMFMSYLGDSVPLWDYPGETLTIVGVAAFDDWKRDKNGIELLDEEGALIPCKRTIWKGELGKLWHSTSGVAYSFCKRALWPVMTADNRPGDLLAPVKIKIGRRPTKSGNSTFKFDIVSE